MKTYKIAYQMNGNYGYWEKPSYIEVNAKNQFDAYDVAFWESIPEKEGRRPAAAWVDSVRYKNGNVKQFNYDIGF